MTAANAADTAPFGAASLKLVQVPPVEPCVLVCNTDPLLLTAKDACERLAGQFRGVVLLR